MRPVIFARQSLTPSDELTAMVDAGWDVVISTHKVQAGDLVVGRYSVLPFYKDIERDLRLSEATLINTLAQHRYVADVREYAADLKEMTPETWTRLEDLPEDGPFVLKGETNSRKFDWNTHMFANNKRDAIVVHSRLVDDSLIREQNIVIRRYVPLKTYLKGIKDLPVTKEFRFFVCYGVVLCGGYYWSSHVDDLPEVPSPDEVPPSFLQEALRRIGDRVNFYALDVAQTESGDWIVIELNDGQMSGTSCNDLPTLYRRLKEVIQERHAG